MYSILNFKTIKLYGYEFSDFNIHIKIPEALLTEDKTYRIRVEDDARIDIISLNEYGTNIYSDLILLINELSPLDLPKSIDFLEESIELHMQEILQNLQYTPDEVELARLKKDISNKWYTKNELYRNIKLIRPNYLASVIEGIKNANSL